VQDEILSLGDAWAGKVKLSVNQVHLISIAGVLAGISVGVGITIITSLPLGVLAGSLLAGILWFYPRDKFVKGVPKKLLLTLEREAPLLSGFMYRARGVAGLSIQQAFVRFVEMYGDTETAAIVKRTPDSISTTKAILGLEFPSSFIPNWLEVISTMDSVHELGNPERVLADMRDNIQEREEQFLRALAKKKAFQAPIVTVLLLLLPLMGLILIPVIVQAAGAVGGL